MRWSAGKTKPIADKSLPKGQTVCAAFKHENFTHFAYFTKYNSAYKQIHLSVQNPAQWRI